MADEPMVTPTKREEEYSRTTSPEGQQEVRTRTVKTPGQITQEVATQAGGSGGRTVRTSQTIAPSPQQVQSFATKRRLFYAYQLIWYVLGYIEIVLAFRFVLKLLGANPESGFAAFIYGASGPFAQPFLSLFRPSVGLGAETAAVLEWTTLIAAFVYALVAWAIVKVLRLSKPVSPEEIEQGVQQE